jgi:GDPmannose 4,6-dehydratase
VTTALVTGVGGQDGILVARRLVAEGCRVVGTVRPDWSSPLAVYLDGVDLVEMDVRDGAAMDDLVREVRPDEIYQLAGMTSVADSWRDPELVVEVNDRAVERLLGSCRTHVPASRVFLASSAEVFGPAVVGRCTETTPLDPRSPYAESKARIHEHATAARNAGQFVAVGVLFNHESQIRGTSFVTRKISRAVASMVCGGTERMVLGNLDVSRDWGAAADTVEAMVRMVRADEPRVVIVATGVLRTVRELVEAAAEVGGLDDPWSRVIQDPALMRAIDTPGAVADTTMATEWLGWSPSTSFADLIATMVTTDIRRIETGVEESPEYLDARVSG